MCFNCMFGKNWVSTEELSKGSRIKPVAIRCQRCGVGTAPKMPVKVSGNFLECLPLEGIAARIPAGAPDPEGKCLAGNASGPYPIGEYMEKFNVDPVLNWCYRHPEARGCKDLPPYIPMPGETVPSSVKEPSGAKEDLVQKALQKLIEEGKISEAAYAAKTIAIAKLRNLKDKNLISQEDYVNDTRAILGKDPKDILGL